MLHNPFLWNIPFSSIPQLILVSRASFICHITPLYVTLLLYMSHYSFICHMTPLYVPLLRCVSHDSFICHITPLYVTLLLYMSHYSSYVTLLLYMSHYSFILLLCMSHYSFICHSTPLYITWLLHMSHDSFVCHTTHVSAFTLSQIVIPYLCDMTHPYLTWHTRLEQKYVAHNWKDVFVCVPIGCQHSRFLKVWSLICVTGLIHIWHDSHA